MIVTVVPHESSRQDFHDWEVRVLARPGGSRAVFNLLLSELKAELIRQQGFPDRIDLVRESSPQIYDWRYASDAYVRYMIEDSPGGMFRSSSRRIVILRITQHRLAVAP